MVIGFCEPRPELGAGYSSVQLPCFVWESIPSARSATLLPDYPTHTRNTYILYILAAVPLKWQLPSNHRTGAICTCYSQCNAVSVLGHRIHVSFMWTACANGIDGRRFPLCKSTALRLSVEESTKSLHSCGS